MHEERIEKVNKRKLLTHQLSIPCPPNPWSSLIMTVDRGKRITMKRQDITCHSIFYFGIYSHSLLGDEGDMISQTIQDDNNPSNGKRTRIPSLIPSSGVNRQALAVK